MTPESLSGAATAIFGLNWQTPLAEALGVSPRTVRRWRAGSSPVPSGVESDIHRLAKAKIKELRSLAR